MRQMTALVKPASSLCNLKCGYCFYCDEASEREKNFSSVMDIATAENLIKKMFDFCGDNSALTFMFQGGEPLIAGLDFFKKFVETAEELKTEGSAINYSLQTNGTLISEEFCEFFKKHDFLIGVSLDGKKELHDKMRSQSFDKAMRGIELLKKYDVDFNILSVITAESDASELFDFYIKNGFRDVQPIYCLDPLGGEKAEYSLGAKQLARFKKRLFNLWFAEVSKGNHFYVRDFDNILSLITKGKAEQCGASGRCNAQLVVEADGTCYPCDFYCLDEYECLNINKADINDILNCEGLKKFFEHDEEKNSLCPACPVKAVCGGGCKRYRSLYNQLSGYCPQKDFILHVLDKLRTIEGIKK
ncbi:MAG: 4Fe-4S cluster-binding domain-containing protein [Clostridia bacterium]|nr:4Fe-4S cluster-binding domain-containing protein [Clostridia bacterium]